MTTEEKRAKIAEACGLFWHTEDQHEEMERKTGDVRGMPYALLRCKCGAYRFVEERNWSFDSKHEEAPDYLNDLNAMAQAEAILSEIDEKWGSQQWRYTSKLSDIVGVDAPTHEPMPNEEAFKIIRATAAQRAEAFGRALNLWT